MRGPSQRRLIILSAALIAWTSTSLAEEGQTTRPPAATSQPAALTRLNREYTALLRAAVTEDGLVHYEVLDDPAQRARLNGVVKAVAQADLPSTKAGRLAFWSNAYNVNVLAKVVTARATPGFESVIKVDGFFDADQITVAGEAITLNDLENKRIRPLGDARIHAALVCAAMSCPPLRSEPFTAEQLEVQFDDQCRRWVNDRSKFRVTNERLGMSQILDWYGEDFNTPPFHSQVGFVRAYAETTGGLARFIAGHDGRPPVEYLAYDWSLNQAPRR
jgi:hypothetical protein